MTYTPQNRLEEVLVKAATDAMHRLGFYQELIRSDLFFIQEGDSYTAQGRTKLEAEYRLRLAKIEWNGLSCIPVFSSLTRLQEFVRHEATYVALNALEIMKITQGENLMLNPGAKYGKHFTKEEIASIINGTIFKQHEELTFAKGTKLQIGEPARYPTELVAALTRLFQREKRVRLAYVAICSMSGSDERPHTLIAVYTTGDWDALVASAGMIVRDVSTPDPPVDFVRIDGTSEIDLYFLKLCKPFYKKKFLGLF